LRDKPKLFALRESRRYSIDCLNNSHASLPDQQISVAFDTSIFLLNDIALVFHTAPSGRLLPTAFLNKSFSYHTIDLRFATV
jgi:hypothetical protein